MAKYCWIPVYLEPPEYPGLRAGVVVGLYQVGGSKAKVLALVSTPIMEAMVKGHAEWANAMFEQTVNSLGNYMAHHHSFAHWVPDIPGAILGQEKCLRAETLEDALEKASNHVLSTSAFLAQGPVLPVH